ncbi:MAG: transcription-repair coupling factor, partial [Candidatus Poribacteria bacterium]|nr:transcription-repair coupling factor [Candidatus Poribacteria bacterium]
YGILADAELYYPFLLDETTTLLDSLPNDTLLYINETRWMNRELTRFVEKFDQIADDSRENNALWVKADEAFVPFGEVIAAMERMPRIMVAAGATEGESDAPRLSMGTIPVVEEKGSLQSFFKGMEKWHRDGYRVSIYSESAKASEQMRAVLDDHDLIWAGVETHVGWVSDPFQSEALRLVVMPQDAIFGRQARTPHRQSKFKDGRPLLSLIELQERDYVVHITHGIAQYMGIKRMKVGNEEHDFLALQYGGSDMLYVPTYNINMVQKYIGSTGESGPRLDRLGSASWEKAKSRVKASVEALAKDLLELYAVRQSTKGHAFNTDTTWQHEFAAAFLYDETPDQLRAIEDVLEDLAKPRPMDRLVCGDVGYGKTEVAMRAAFTAVSEGLQVAVLVPTTILAQQHHQTFQLRFREFPVEVRQISRLASTKDVAQAMEGLEKGTIDIVIGTHRLLSKDIKFRNLGLLVIDEEHRFGVKQKEMLRQLKKQVDTLTLTATPIPRTLNMAMSGVRDLSVITTPPENRLPIETYVTEYRPDTVRQAILREMARDGQIFFVHNRVQGIESVAMNLQQLVPEARIGVAHGQMNERMLESMMMRFVHHEFDVLVCTTIIESGLDIPNVNTILINRADALGLAQLYQLRGRVGRSDRRAYGYLFYPEDRAMSEGAQKRLRVIEEFTELGSGFKIAMHDMEIRGAGNLLGPEQHGSIAAVGYDMYCKLLENAIAELKGEEVVEEVETKITLPISVFIPDDYVEDGAAKMRFYQRIASIRDREDRDVIEAELRDRYGNVPEPAIHLLEVATLKARAARLGITTVSVSGSRAQLVFDEGRANVDPSVVLELMRRDPSVELVPPSKLAVRLASSEPHVVLETLERVLVELDRDPTNTVEAVAS